MNKKSIRALSFSLAVCMGLSMLALSASAQSSYGDTAEATHEAAEYQRALTRRELGLSGVTNKRTYAYSRVSVYYNGVTVSTSALSIKGVTYVGLRAFAGAFGAKVSYNPQTRTSVMTYNGLTLSVTDGAYVMYANSRPVFALSNTVIMNDGYMYAPLASLAKVMGLSVSETAGRATLHGSVKPMTAKAPYTEDEVFWLARIIQAESNGESLLGKIGVGTVVLNRVASNQYPNTIYGVIFDRKYGVQFSPVLNGTIYNTPNYQSRLAAMICLEGVRLSDRALFFLEPSISTSSWIPKNREYLFTIPHHDFYA